MTHVPDCDKEPKRVGKVVAICGAEVSVRKAVSAAPSCPTCLDLDIRCMEDLPELFGSMRQAVQLILDRRAFIVTRRFLARRRKRK